MNEVLTSWEEMTVLEQMQCQYWDMYKDAYGVRPRAIDTTSWTEADFMAEFDLLATVINAEDLARKEAEAIAIEKFEQHVINTMCMGARDRETALLNGLPYRYFEKV